MGNERKLIYADEALRMIANSKEDSPFENVRGQGAIWRTAHNSAADCVNACAAVDAVPVVHGKWKYGTRSAVCSACGFERHLDDNFGAAISCPNCSAKMDGDTE